MPFFFAWLAFYIAKLLLQTALPKKKFALQSKLLAVLL
jgi:hypothetical protein